MILNFRKGLDKETEDKMNDVITFESEEFGKIRTVEKDGEPWFVGRDVAIALGYAKPQNAIPKFVDTDDALKQGITDNLGRIQDTTIINESGVYSLILSSKLESAKRFKRWVTHEVIPSIRKNGAYIRGQEDMSVSNEELIARALVAAKKIIDDKNAILEAQKPKVAYYDAMVSCDGLTNFRETAKVFGIKERVLTKFLVDHGFCYRDKTGILTAYARYSNATDRPLFVKKEFMKQYGVILTQTRFTPYGRQKIYQAIQNEKVG